MLTPEEQRIGKFLNGIYRIWRKHPELRFMQLLNNGLKDTPKGVSDDWFYLEDVELERALKKYYAECFSV